MRLGEMLLAEKLVSGEALEEALESQVVHGGRLGTNLLELGLIEERDLVRTLGKQHNVAFAVGEMKPDARALEMVDPRFADDKDLLPMRVDATRLTIAAINPHDFTSLDSIAFKTGRRVVPVVIAEFRMSQLLRRHCKAFRPMRAIDMNIVRPSRSRPKAAEVPDGAPAKELIGEDEFQKLYVRAMAGGADDLVESGLVQPIAVPPNSFLPSADRPAIALPTESPAIVAPPASVSLPSAVPAPSPPAAVAIPTPPAPSRSPRSRIVLTPLPFDKAQQQLAEVSDREEIARTILRFALTKWKRALLLSVQGPLVTGWQGAGEGVSAEAVSKVGIQLSGQSPVRLVCETSSHYVGPMKPSPTLDRFYEPFGKGYPNTAVLLPLLVRGRVVHILYVDNGANQVTPPDIGELLILAQNVARCYEALIRQRQS